MSSCLIASKWSIFNRSLHQTRFKIASDHFSISTINAWIYCVSIVWIFKEAFSNFNSSMDTFNFGAWSDPLMSIKYVVQTSRYCYTEKDPKSQWSVTIELHIFFYLSIGKCSQRNKCLIAVLRSNKSYLVLTTPRPFHVVCMWFIILMY
jgi:hypothetical protein